MKNCNYALKKNLEAVNWLLIVPLLFCYPTPQLSWHLQYFGAAVRQVPFLILKADPKSWFLAPATFPMFSFSILPLMPNYDFFPHTSFPTFVFSMSCPSQMPVLARSRLLLSPVFELPSIVFWLRFPEQASSSKCLLLHSASSSTT